MLRRKRPVGDFGAEIPPDAVDDFHRVLDEAWWCRGHAPRAVHRLRAHGKDRRARARRPDRDDELHRALLAHRPWLLDEFRGRGAMNLLIFVPMTAPEVILGASMLTLWIAVGTGRGALERR